MRCCMAVPVVPDIKENEDRCLCPECPTYNECMSAKNQRIFCSRGNTVCSLDEEGCICEKCPVWNEYPITSFYYCRSSFKI